MARNIDRTKSVPSTLSAVPPEVAKILQPMIHNIELRFLRRNSRTRAVTRQDLIDLGLASQADVDNLEDR